MNSSAGLRKRFLDFFQERGHTQVASSTLVPANDPTLLFTNAGMVPFKEVFLGHEKRSYTRAVSSQRCVRAGGKHNDLENVGYTSRHHTFFEMLGNFSFGDYFKREAIQYAWAFITEELEVPADKLWVTVYQDDDEAAAIWLDEIGVSKDRLVRLGDKDNFWSMGDTGPCGPCTEIFYDHGDSIEGGPPGSPDEDGDRYVEIWNLVFMQYNRDDAGTLTPLPKPSVDTGMGLERLAAVMQRVHGNYEIDLFVHLIDAVAKLLGMTDKKHNSLRVIADHIRSTSFLIADGVMPSNEGRGYVLRRIIRRAIRHGNMLGMKTVFFHKLVAPLVAEMGDAYPELRESQALIERVLAQEEARFAETLEQGLQILEQDIADLEGDTLAGSTVFKLYDTFGFPADLTADIARERGLKLDMDGCEQEMTARRDRARAAGQFRSDFKGQLAIEGESIFTGYDHIESQAQVVALFQGDESVDQLNEGDEGVVILDETPFYAESGGQAGDRGELVAAQGQFSVDDTQKQVNGVILHHGVVRSGIIRMDERLDAQIDDRARTATGLNHSATHLLHAALRQLLGRHVTQKGSLVDAERLRFDFSHFEAVTREQLDAVEDLVNQQIRANDSIDTQLMTPDEAKDSGAMALFGEKYGDEVRVLTIGTFSQELCGGTHAKRAGDVGLFKIVSEGGIASGVRRIEALTGQKALDWVAEDQRQLASIAALVKGGRDNVGTKVQQLHDRQRLLEKELDRLKMKLASSAGDDLATQAQDIKGTKVLAVKLEGVDPKSLRDTVDQLKNKLAPAAIIVATTAGDKVSIVAGVTAERTDIIKASALANHVAQQVGGKGGGRADMAQAGGNQPAALDAALASVPEWIADLLG